MMRNPGPHQADWDGRADDGTDPPAGVYRVAAISSDVAAAAIAAALH